jgi:nitrogen-specific signal transduction histidine kinase
VLKKADQHALATRVEACPGPAWVIDAEGGEIIAANEAGAELLALGSQRSARFDRTMPAMTRLAELARRPSSAPAVNDNLVFTTARGTLSMPCRIEPMKQKVRGRLLLVELINRNVVTNDDRVTLARIAGKILEGRQPQSTCIVTTDEDGRAACPQVPPLAAKVAHEIKTPISAIAAAAEIMKEERFGPIGNARYREYAADILKSAEHALMVIDRLLGAARTSAGRADLVFAELDLNEIAKSATSAVAPLAESQSIEIKTSFASRLPHVVADATSVRQILFNLLTNALKFTAAGGKVQVVTRYVLDGPVSVTVSDTGTGMTREAIDLALNPRARNWRIASSGLGLGLPTAAALAEANGASLEIKSDPGSGTAVTVFFSKSRVVPVW